jgi:hypothetical protein
MWGETGHSTVIPYASMHQPDDLRRWMIDHGFHTILINTQYAMISKSDPGWQGMVASLTVDSGNQPLYSHGSECVYGL